jgi:peptide/nickel transport system substrate-binding protein
VPEARSPKPEADEWLQALLALVTSGALIPSVGCLRRPVENPNIIVLGMTSGPNSLDARLGSDDTSQKLEQLIYSSLMTLDDHLQAVPQLAEHIEIPDPKTYIITVRRGVKFHDGHELTARDVAYTFESLLAPTFVSPLRGAYRLVESVVARDRYTVVFHLKQPFGSFLGNLILPPIVPDGAGPGLRDHPIGTGPYKFVRYLADDRLEHQLEREPTLHTAHSPGTDYQYLGVNLRDPILKELKVRQALVYAIDYEAIIEHLRRGLAYPAVGMIPRVAWSFEPDVFAFTYDPAQAKRLLDEAGYPDPDGDGPQPRFSLSLKVSNIEYNRLQSAVIQQNL